MDNQTGFQPQHLVTQLTSTAYYNESPYLYSSLESRNFVVRMCLSPREMILTLHESHVHKMEENIF